MRINKFLLLVVFVLGMVCISMAQITSSYPIRLQWNGLMEERNDYDTSFYISLQSAEYVGAMPVYYQSFPIFDHHVDAKVVLDKMVTAPLAPEEMQLAKAFSVAQDFEVTAIPIRSREESFLSVRIVPFRQQGGKVEKLVSATLSVTLAADFEAQKSNPSFADRSAMAS